MMTIEKVIDMAAEVSEYNEDTIFIVYWNKKESVGRILSEEFYSKEKNDSFKAEGFIPVVCFENGLEYSLQQIAPAIWF